MAVDRLIDQRADIGDRRTDQDRERGQRDDPQRLSGRIQLSAHVFFAAGNQGLAVEQIDKADKEQGRQGAHPGADRRACRAVDRRIIAGSARVPGQAFPEQKVTGQYADHDVQDLLKDLRYGRGNHGPVSLEKAADHAQHPHDEDRRGQGPDRQRRLGHGHDRPGQKVGAEHHDQSGSKPHSRAEQKAQQEKLPHIPVLLQTQLGRHQLGDRHRQAVGRDQKKDIVDAEGRAVYAHAGVADDRDHRDPVQDADQPADDPGRRQDPSLHQEIVSAFLLF